MSREHARSRGHSSASAVEESSNGRDPRMMAAMHRRHQQRREEAENPIKTTLLMAVGKHKEAELDALLTFEHSLHKAEEAEASVGPEFSRQLGEKIFDGLVDDLKDVASEVADIGKETIERASVVYGAAKSMIESEIARGEKLTAAQAASKIVAVARRAIEKNRRCGRKSKT
jgi:hypothetical protein